MRLYIANRGEIACRVISTAKKMGVSTLVGYASIDKDLPFVAQADESVEIDENDPKQAYLNPKIVLETAQKMKATHLHPGYGFLSENADFVDLCNEAGIVFVGPSSESIRQLGDKIGSRHFLKQHQISLLPSYDEEDQSEKRLFDEAEKLGYPLLIKPSAGGGGKGMFIVEASEKFLENLRSSKRIAKSSFGDERVFLEKLVRPARHIEVQILADSHGNVISIGERECSLQRRHQKVIEETPCQFLSESLREKIYEASVRIAKAVQYCSAGTIEWIWDGQDGIYFLEANTRLQVEHPVTEHVWGIDLVEWQLRVAQGESLSELRFQPKGHAIEARLCTEDPAQNFMPSGGKIHRLRFPEEARVDVGYFEGNEVSGSFDSMMGKIICGADSRKEALAKLIEALEKTTIFGPTTNRAYLLQILKSDFFENGDLSTNLLEKFSYQFNWKRALAQAAELARRPSSTILSDEDESLDYYSPWGQISRASSAISWWEDFGNKRYFHLPELDWSVARPRPAEVAQAQDDQAFETKIISPMPSRVIDVLVSEGQEVKKGDLLLILEAMKMEHQIKASFDARVKTLSVSKDQQVPPDELLIELEAIEVEKSE